MALPVVIVAAGGLPMNRLSVHGGLPVTLAAQGLAVTEGLPGLGLPMTFVTEGGSVVLPVPPVTYTTWNPADLLRVVLSNGNLTATNNATTQPSGVRAVKSQSTGKYYWEATMGTWASFSTGIGMGNASQAFNSAALGTGGIFMMKDGTVFRNASGSGMPSFGIRSSGNIIGMAVNLDMTPRSIWFRVAPAGNWNTSGTANPATGVGGIDISAITGALFPLYSPYTANDAVTANFGASAFSGAVPSGFTSGWPT